MINRIRSKIKGDFRQMYTSIKLPEVEEWFDMYFSRFFGYYLAVAARKLHLTPHQVSLLSLITGIFAGILFYFQDDITLILWACFLVTLSGLLDSADGQLARMTNSASDLGRKVDAIIDTLVFAACYTGGAMYFLPSYGWYIIPLAALAGYLHSAKSAAYEFYKMEFILYIKGSESHRIKSLEEIKASESRGGFINECLYYLELDYTRKQAMFIYRSDEDRLLFSSWTFSEKHQSFANLYKKYNEKILTPWALICGTNMHRNYLMVCALFGRIDIYFLITIITYLPMIWVGYKQKNQDKLLIAEMNELIGKSQ